MYLLSIGEATNPSYGFCESYSTWSASRQLKVSDYAHARGVGTSTSSAYAGNCWWWLRSPGGITYNAAFVNYYGCVNSYGEYVYFHDNAVVPALHINLSSNLWSMTDDGTSGVGGEDSESEKLLAQAKESSKNELDTYKDASAYREEQKKELSEAIAAGKKAIDEAEDEEEVKRILDSVKEAIDKIKTDEQLKKEEEETTAAELSQAKESSKQELDGYKDASAYREDQKKELSEAIAAGKKAIDAAEDEEGVKWALTSAKAVIDNIKTDEQLKEEEKELTAAELRQTKESSKQELVTYKDASAYREDQKKELSEAIAAGKKAIDEAEDKEGVRSALASAKEVIDRIKTDAKLTEEENQSIAEKLSQAKESSKNELDAYKDATAYREEQKKELSEAIAAGKKAIDAAKDEEGVKWALTSAKAVIDKIKTDAQLALEEQKKDEENQNPGTENENPGTENENPGTENQGPSISNPKGTSIKGALTAKANSFTVKWKKAASVAGYQIQYSTSKKFTKKTTKLETVEEASKTSLTVKKLKAAKKYYVRIRTYKTVDGNNYYSTWSKAKSVDTLYAKKTSIKGKLTAKAKSFTVQWKKTASVTGYQIQYSTSKKFTKKTTKIKTVKKASQTKLTVKKLKAKKTYYVRVRTYKTIKKNKFYSAWSSRKQVKIKK